MLKKLLIVLLISAVSSCNGYYLEAIKVEDSENQAINNKLQGYNLLSQITEDDLEFHESTLQDALELNLNSVSSTWKNSKTGNSGSITPTDYYLNDKRQNCRHFQQKIINAKGAIEFNSKACRNGEKDWEIIEN